MEESMYDLGTDNIHSIKNIEPVGKAKMPGEEELVNRSSNSCQPAILRELHVSLR
jgi:hypothetical protein